jgi:signal peptidase I
VQRGQEELLKATLVADVLREHGHVRLRAYGSSMFPTFKSGHEIFVERSDAHTVEPGDVVLVWTDDRLFAHRLIRKQLDGEEPVIVTRGDAHWTDDPPRPASAVIGRVVSITRDGCVVNAPFRATVRDRVYGLMMNESTRLARRARQRARAIFVL